MIFHYNITWDRKIFIIYYGIKYQLNILRSPDIVYNLHLSQAKTCSIEDASSASVVYSPVESSSIMHGTPIITFIN